MAYAATKKPAMLLRFVRLVLKNKEKDIKQIGRRAVASFAEKHLTSQEQHIVQSIMV